MFLKPRKKREMITLYIAGAIGQLLTIILWVYPTLDATHYTDVSHNLPSLGFSLFSYSGSNSVGTNVLNIAILVLSVVSLVLLVIPLIRKTVMKPRLMILPVVLNLVYLILFYVRLNDTIDSNPSFVFSFTPVFYLYAIGLVLALSTALTILVYYPILKKQAAPAETV